MSVLGKTLFIVNPSAKNGSGAQAVPVIKAALKDKLDYELAYTTHEKHGFELAQAAAGFDTVVSVGGDGNAHDVANGILALAQDSRPAFALIPMGSGNDYARTLDMPFKTEEAISALVGGKRCRIDCGKCNDRYFLESVSFGVDAAIAIGTIELRKKTGGSGTSLYMQSGFDVICNHYNYHKTKVTDAAGKVSEHDYIIFCVTIGKTYGGGFYINPDATGQSGMLNICTATPMSRKKALLVFVLASKGHHTGFKNMAFMKTPKISLDYAAAPPTQFDGEPQHGLHFDISIIPRGLEVVVPQASHLNTDY